MELIVRHPRGETRVSVTRVGHETELRFDDVAVLVERRPTGDGTRSLLVAGRQYEVGVAQLGGARYRVSSTAGTEVVQVLDPLTHLAEKSHAAAGREGLRTVGAYMPGRVVQILVEEGQEVAAGQGLVVLEAMKMENEIQAEAEGIVRRIFVEQGQAVDGGDPLFEIE